MKKNKRGIFLPLVIIILLVLGMMGYVFNRVSSTEFRQAYFMSDMMRAQMIAEAAVEEIMADIRAKMNNEDEFRKAFIEGGDIKKYTLEHAKKFKDDLYAMEDDATTNPVSYSVKAKVYCKKDNLEVINSTEDKIGTLVIEVISEVNSVAREIKVSFDYKVVDVRPVGNKYTLMVGTSGPDSFNVSNHFYVNSLKSDGISIGGQAVINLHNHYNTKSGWGKSKNLGLHESENTDKSLIPGGGQKLHFPSWEAVTNNEPFENSTSGKNIDSKTVEKYKGESPIPSDYEHGDPSDEKEGGMARILFPMQLSGNGYGAFNTGWIGGNAFTHLFGGNVDASKTTIFGNVKKRYTVYNQQWTNTQMITGSYEDGCPICIAVFIASEGSVESCPQHLNPLDWTSDDSWKVVVWQKDAVKEYKTSESKIESSAKWSSESVKPELNLKGDFAAYKKTATRYVESFPSELWDTFMTPSSKRLYLEGVVACEKAEVKIGQEFKTPGIIVSEKSMNVSGGIKAGEKTKSDKGDFFKQINVLSLMSFERIENDGSVKSETGFFSKNNFNSKNMKIEGNLIVDNLSSAKQFDGNLRYSEKLKDSSYLIDSDKSYVITVSPIPSSFVIVNNL